MDQNKTKTAQRVLLKSFNQAIIKNKSSKQNQVRNRSSSQQLITDTNGYRYPLQSWRRYTTGISTDAPLVDPRHPRVRLQYQRGSVLTVSCSTKAWSYTVTTDSHHSTNLLKCKLKKERKITHCSSRVLFSAWLAAIHANLISLLIAHHYPFNLKLIKCRFPAVVSFPEAGVCYFWRHFYNLENISCVLI